VRSLISTLLDESHDPDDRTYIIDCERMDLYEQFQALQKQSLMLGPLLELSNGRVLSHAAVDRLAAAAPSETVATKIYQSHVTPKLGTGAVAFAQRKYPPGVAPDFAGVFEDPPWNLSRYLTTEWKVTAERRCAAIALAIRLYRADHHEAWPAALPELVPDYLSRVPDDPFAPNPSPMGYIIRKNATPDGHDRPMLYFALTGNPATTPLPPNPDFDWAQSNGQWRDLSRWYPVASSP
jgi:hypothetical protein